MTLVLLIGRIMLAMIFIGAGFAGHLGDTASTAAYAESRGVKNAKVLVQVSGVLIAAAGLGVVFGVFMDIAALGMAAYCLIAAFMVHHFWTDTDQTTQTVEMSMFMKNLAIAGGAIILFVFATVTSGSLGLTITEPVFSFDL